jgi:hypothetical protein
MKRARVPGIDETIVPYLNDLDRSDKVLMDGEVSKRIYMELFHSRSFNLYGKLVKSVVHPQRKHLELRYLASQLGIEFTEKMESSFLQLEPEPTEEELIAIRKSKIPKVTTEKWKIGHPEVYKPPVGFAKNPKEPFNSLGNEIYFSYDGTWKAGKMHGKGIFVFEDEKSYDGDFANNRPNGIGNADYIDGRHYEGDWKDGVYQGKGTYWTDDGLKFEGDYVLGRRNGIGKLKFPCGLIYEGEFRDNKPHGRGTMRSKLSGWAYEGTFEKGFICGAGTIITPPPEKKRVIYYYAETREKVTLPGLVRIYLDELKQEKINLERKRNEVFAPLRGAQLRDYVNSIRSTLYNERLREKKERYNETVLKAKEHKAKLYEARMKALAGELEEDDV